MKRAVTCLLTAVFLFSACSLSHDRSTNESREKSAEPEADAGSAADSHRGEPDSGIPSLYVDIDGETILLVDMDNPIVRSAYPGCGGYDVSSLKFSITNWATGEDIEGYVDPRYTYPIYTFTAGTHEEYADMACQLWEGGRFMDFVVQAQNNDGLMWGGFLFDNEGFPVSCCTWYENSISRSSLFHVQGEMMRYEDNIYGFQNYFEIFATPFVMTDMIYHELEDREFDLSRTSVITGGFYSSYSYLFTDGQHEVIMCGGDTIDGIWDHGDFVSSREWGRHFMESLQVSCTE